MKIIKKPAWINVKCNNCGNTIYQSKEENEAYFCSPDYTQTKIWKLCEICFNKLFSEEVRKKVK